MLALMYGAPGRRYPADMTTLDTEELIELYAATSHEEGDRIVQLLEQDGIEALARDVGSSSFPTTSPVLILVPAHNVDVARGTIENARREGAITDGGEFQVRP